MTKPSRAAAGLIERVGRMALPLEGPADLDPLLERIGDAHYVLLGEASHGTSEYYRWRARISQRLICEKGFSFIAVEGDWPDCYRVNRYVKGYPDSGTDAHEVLFAFARWQRFDLTNDRCQHFPSLREFSLPCSPRRDPRQPFARALEARLRDVESCGSSC